MKQLIIQAFIFAICSQFIASSATAGGPLSSCYGLPIKYSEAGSVSLNYDQGSLGTRTKAQADSLVSEAVSVWTNVETSTIVLSRGTDLPVDVAISNYPAYIGSSNSYFDGLNPVVYDSDGSIIENMLGIGSKNHILGFAGSVYYINNCQNYLEGQAVLNGFLSTTDIELKLVITHEIGHLIGLDHTQLNYNQGLTPANYPLMYPIAYRNSLSLHEDDIAAISTLYPEITINNLYGQLSGTFTQANGAAILGANLWVNEINTGQVFSIVSDYLMQSTGYFKLLLPPGTYNLHAEAVQLNFINGSSVGPYSDDPYDSSFSFPLYNNGVAMTPVTLGNTVPNQIVITAGCSAAATFKFDGTGSIAGNCFGTIPSTPTQIAPSGQINSTTPTFTWNASSNTTTYSLYLSGGSTPASLVSYSTASLGCGAGTGICSVTPSIALTNGGTYSWFVQASNSVGSSAWSTGKIFTVNTLPPPSTPTLIAPSGAANTQTPTFTWNASSNAATYSLYVSGGSTPASLVSYSAASLGCGAGTGICSVTPSTPLTNGGSYSWFALASNTAGNSAWSTGKIFTVNTLPPPSAPALIAPSGTANTQTPTFTWNASSNAATYSLYVSGGSTPVSLVSYSAASLGCGAGTGMCSVTPSVPLTNGGTYSWFVQASNSTGISAWSTGKIFTVNTLLPPSSPTLIAPSGTANTQTPTFTWNASSNAATYSLYLSGGSTPASLVSYSAVSLGCGAGTGICSVTPSVPLTNSGTYSWFVQASNSAGSSAWSNGKIFTVNIDNTPPTAPTLIAPSGSVSSTTPTFSWNASSTATSYFVYISGGSTPTSLVSYSAVSLGCSSGTGMCLVTPSTPLTNGGSYSWFVLASNSTGNSAWSSGKIFKVNTGL